jgi:hypothetical protein
VSETAPEAPEVVGWVDVDALAEREDWASRLERDQLVDVLRAAYEEAVEFGPLLPGGRRWTPEHTGDVPARFAVGQVMHARDIARASYTDQTGQVGPDGFALTVWPMDRAVKQRYRPKRAVRKIL